MNEEPGQREQEGTRHDTKRCVTMLVVFCLVQVWTGKARRDGKGGRLAVSGSGFGCESPLRAARSGRMHSL